jgi:AcrR family transcriptional regulator
MAPKTKEQFEEIRQQSMDAIMQAALELFGHNGFHSTSISKIAKEAGISKGLIYNYFDSKEDLLKRIILEAIETGEHLMEDAIHDSEDPFQQLQYLIESSFEMVKSNLHYWKLVTSLAFQGDVLDPVKEIILEKNEKWMEIGLALFTKTGAKDPMKEALFFGATLDGIILHYMHVREEYPLEEMKNYVIEKFCTPR